MDRPRIVVAIDNLFLRLVNTKDNGRFVGMLGLIKNRAKGLSYEKWIELPFDDGSAIVSSFLMYLNQNPLWEGGEVDENDFKEFYSYLRKRPGEDSNL